jgi:hypothetical protein
MSFYQEANIKSRRAHWLAIEFALYLLAVLMLGAQFACLWASCPT